MSGNGDNYGTVTQVIGSVLDAEFEEGKLPKIYNALKVTIRLEIDGEKTERTLWCEVASHLGGGRVRAIALGGTDGLLLWRSVIEAGVAAVAG